MQAQPLKPDDPRLARIVAEYPHRITRDLASDLGMHIATLRLYASRLGVAKSEAFMSRERRVRSAEEDALVRDSWRTATVPAIAKKLGCSKKIVYKIAERLGLPQRRDAPIRRQKKVEFAKPKAEPKAEKERHVGPGVQAPKPPATETIAQRFANAEPVETADTVYTVAETPKSRFDPTATADFSFLRDWHVKRRGGSLVQTEVEVSTAGRWSEHATAREKEAA